MGFCFVRKSSASKASGVRTPFLFPPTEHPVPLLPPCSLSSLPFLEGCDWEVPPCTHTNMGLQCPAAWLLGAPWKAKWDGEAALTGSSIGGLGALVACRGDWSCCWCCCWCCWRGAWDWLSEDKGWSWGWSSVRGRMLEMCAGWKDTVAEEGEPWALRLSLNDKLWNNVTQTRQGWGRKKKVEGNKEEENCISLFFIKFLFHSLHKCINLVAPLTCFGTSVARERADIRILLFLLNKKEFNGRIIIMNAVWKHFSVNTWEE